MTKEHRSIVKLHVMLKGLMNVVLLISLENGNNEKQ